LRRLIRLLVRARAVDRALEYARRAVSADPLREESHRDLIRLYSIAGQPTAAWKQYQELERILQQELGEAPSAATRALAEQLPRAAVAGEAVRHSRVVAGQQIAVGQQPSPAPARQDSALLPLPNVFGGPARNTPRLPLQLTRFFGREGELARLE